MSAMTLFGDNTDLVSNSLLESLQGVNDNLVGGSFGTTRRISFRGGKFRRIVNGEQMDVSHDNEMNIIILDAATLSRTFYEGSYDPDNITSPSCWSPDASSPDESIEEPQSNNCQTCPQNVKGSGQGDTRACRYGQRLAIAIEGDLETVYQISLAATSIFGDKVGDNMPMQAYAKFLNAHNAPAIGIVTKMAFDDNSDVPKLFFSAVRPLDEEELEAAIALKDTPEVEKAVTLTVAQTDHVEGAKEEAPAKKAPVKKAPVKKAAKKKAAKKKAAPAKVNEVDEPTVKQPAKANVSDPEEESDDLDSLLDDLDEWDDTDDDE